MLPFISLPPRPEKPPADIHEVISQGQALLNAVGLADSRFELVTPPVPSEPFKGAEVKLVVPEKSLAEVFHREAVKMASQQGAKVSEAKLEFRDAGDQAVEFSARLTAGMFFASLEVRIRGVIHAVAPDKIRFSQVEWDTGSGMLGNMARAMLEPRIQEWTRKEPSIAELVGRPVRWTRFGFWDAKLEGQLIIEQ
jgi:hypothetical protein